MVTNIIIIYLSVIALTIQSSSNGLYVGIVDYTGAHDLFTKSFALYQQSTPLYELKNPSAITFFISNSGDVFATNEQALYHYDLKGNIRLLKELNYPNGFGFSPDNSRFFASDKDGLSQFSVNGTLIATLRPCRLFASNTSGSTITLISTDTLFIYHNNELKHQKILKTPYVRSLEFKDESTVKIEEPSLVETYDCTKGKALEEQ